MKPMTKEELYFFILAKHLINNVYMFFDGIVIPGLDISCFSLLLGFLAFSFIVVVIKILKTG